MTGALEKAARAVLECEASCDDYFNRDIGTLLSVDPETALVIARAVLMAVRDSGPPSRSLANNVGGDEAAEYFWTSLIDAILNEDPK